MTAILVHAPDGLGAPVWLAHMIRRASVLALEQNAANTPSLRLDPPDNFGPSRATGERLKVPAASVAAKPDEGASVRSRS